MFAAGVILKHEDLPLLIHLIILVTYKHIYCASWTIIRKYYNISHRQYLEFCIQELFKTEMYSEVKFKLFNIKKKNIKNIWSWNLFIYLKYKIKHNLIDT